MGGYISWESAMDVDEENSRPQSASRFNHLNAATDDVHKDDNRNMTITAGFNSRPRAVNGCGHPNCESAFEKRVIPENFDNAIRIDIRRPMAECSVGLDNHRSNNYGQNQKVIGVVKIGKPCDTEKPNSNGHVNDQQRQQPQYPFGFGFAGGCRPSNATGFPVVQDPPRPRPFQIQINNGFNYGKLSTYMVEGTTTVDRLMSMIQEKLGIPPDQQVLNYSGRNLQRGMTLEHYHVESGCTIFLTGRLRGGAVFTMSSYNAFGRSHRMTTRGSTLMGFSQDSRRIIPGQQVHMFAGSILGQWTLE